MDSIILAIIPVVISGIVGFYAGYYTKFKIHQQEQATKIASFFAKWIKYNAQEKRILNKKELANYYENLNKMLWELFLWIPDEKILQEIMATLIHDSESKNIKEIIFKMRRLILKQKLKKLKWKNLVHFPKDSNFLEKNKE